jgi:hypothetical protein
MIDELDRELAKRLGAAFTHAVEPEWADVQARAARRTPRRARHRRRGLVLCSVVALLAITASAAIARGWLLDSEPTLATVSQVTPTTPTDVEFAAIISTGQLKNAVEQPVRLLIPAGSIYAGTLIRRADGDGDFTCVAALDGQACGKLTAASPTVSGVISHPGSGLPPLAYGAVTPAVQSVSFACSNGRFPVTLIAGRVFSAVLPLNTDPDSCAVHWTVR